MKAHVNIQIQLKLNEGENLHDILREFARDLKTWVFLKKESEVYQNNIGASGGYLICDELKGIKRALIAIAATQSKQPNSFYVANIVPRECFELTIDEYNAIGSAFVRDFGNWCRKKGGKGQLRYSNPNKTLADIIPAKKCREFFERYLKSSIWDSTTLPVHPSDIEQLDVFICALVRYGAEVSPHELERFLVLDQKWKPEDAAWVRTRIEIGLDVLKVNRKF